MWPYAGCTAWQPGTFTVNLISADSHTANESLTFLGESGSSNTAAFCYFPTASPGSMGREPPKAANDQHIRQYVGRLWKRADAQRHRILLVHIFVYNEVELPDTSLTALLYTYIPINAAE